MKQSCHDTMSDICSVFVPRGIFVYRSALRIVCSIVSFFLYESKTLTMALLRTSGSIRPFQPTLLLLTDLRKSVHGMRRHCLLLTTHHTPLLTEASGVSTVH